MEVSLFLQASPAAFLITVGVVALLVGSFLNVVIHRLPIMMEREWKAECRELLATDGNPATTATEPQERYNLIVPRSRCPHCGHMIRAWENVPVVSYLVLRGRCASCGAAISAQYPLVEALTGLLAVVVAWHFGYTPQTLAALGFTWALIALAVIDLRTQLLPDAITQPLLWAGILVNLLWGLFADVQSSILGAVFGYLSLWLVYHGFKLLTGKEGMGFGDFKLLAALGAWLGWQSLPLIILLSSFVGAAIGIALILIRGRDRNIPLPFGPYLAIAGWIALLWGEDITRSYLGSVGLP